MCTETDMGILPESLTAPSVSLVTGQRWLDVLCQPAVDVALGMVGVHPISSNRITRPRTPDDPYATHYLFSSPDAPVLLQTLHGVRVLSPGSLLWCPPGVPYSLYFKGKPKGQTLFRLRFTVLRKAVHLTPWSKEEVFPGCSWYPEFHRRFLQEFRVPAAHGNSLQRALLTELSVALLRVREETDETAGPITAAVLQQLHHYLLDHIADRPGPQDLAAVAGLSPGYFTKVFTRTQGLSPRRWILEQRIRHGAQLLAESAARVSEVAYWLGYDQPRLFTRQFRDVLGVTPTEYRRKDLTVPKAPEGVPGTSAL